MQTPLRLAAPLALLLVLGAAGCAGSATPLADRAFLSVAVTDGGVARPLVAGTRIRLDFRDKDLGASVGCNSIGGTYRIDDGRLVFTGGSMTEMGCDQDRAAQDTWLNALLSAGPTVRVNGDELILESGSIVVRLLDRKVVEPDLTIAGRTWTVESIISGDAVSNVPGGASATLSFNTDGTVTVDTGCNQGSARWIARGTGIDFADLGLTKKACDGAGAQLEAAVVGVLRVGSVPASIDGSVLTLQAGSQGLQLRAP